jgi:predicted RNA binding protein YcfA (HicA-like mRNA interferase family)
LERLGFAHERQRGSHLVMVRVEPDGERRVCVVPLHDEVAVGTLGSVLRQARITAAELLRAL